MKALVDRLSSEITSEYAQYLETFKIDLLSEAGVIEFHVGYKLHRDRQHRSLAIKVDADSGQTDAEREFLVIVVFDEAEAQIDFVLADRVDAN